MRLILAIAWFALFYLVTPARAQTAADFVPLLCGPGRGALAPLFQAAADRWGVPPVVLVAMARVESSCDPRAVNRRTQAYGLMQIKLDGSANVVNATPDELLAPDVSIDLGARHLNRWARLCGSLVGGLRIYSGKRHCNDGKRDGYARRVLELVTWAKRKLKKLKKDRA